MRSTLLKFPPCPAFAFLSLPRCLRVLPWQCLDECRACQQALRAKPQPPAEFRRTIAALHSALVSSSLASASSSSSSTQAAAAATVAMAADPDRTCGDWCYHAPASLLGVDANANAVDNVRGDAAAAAAAASSSSGCEVRSVSSAPPPLPSVVCCSLCTHVFHTACTTLPLNWHLVRAREI